VLAELTLRVVANWAIEESSRYVAIAAGISPALVEVMGAHPGSAAVQALACRALINITAGTDAQSYARRQAAVDAGALPQIVAVMRAHTASATVQQHACLAVGIVTASVGAQGDARKQTI